MEEEAIPAMFEPNYGDNPEDQLQIQAGIDAYEAGNINQGFRFIDPIPPFSVEISTWFDTVYYPNFLTHSELPVIDNSLLTIQTNPELVPGLRDAAIDTSFGSGVLQGIAYDSGVATVTVPAPTLNANGVANTSLSDIVTDGIRPGNFNNGFESTLWDSLNRSFMQNSNFQSFSPLDAANLNNLSLDSLNSILVDPLVLDLNGDGVRLTDYGSNPVLFDIDNDGGSRELSGWVSPEDGLLVHDLNGNGRIDHSGETFSEYYGGTSSPEGGTRPFRDGFAALESLDSNHDHRFGPADAAWNNVRVWVDADHDGQTDSGELRTLDSLGISRIDLSATTASGLVRDGNEVLAQGTFVRNGITREALALNFLADPNGHIYTGSPNGNTISTQGGVTSYVSKTAGGETIDVGQKGVDNAYGATGNDILIGDAGVNWLAGGGGSDTFSAGADNDVLLIDAEDLQENIHAGAGIDIVQVLGDAGVVLDLAQAEVEVVRGGRGDDIFIGGGGGNVFVRAGAGDDTLIGGAANDALSGEDGDDLIDGGDGNDLLRGHRGRDQITGGAGDDVLQGGQDDDAVGGGSGNDVLEGNQGDDRIDGGEGVDLAQFSGSYADYRVRVSELGVWVTDTRTGRDGADFLVNVEKLGFSDLVSVEIDLDNPFPVNDTVDVAGRTGPITLGKQQLLGNDIDYQGDTLHITAVAQPLGGTVALNANGDVVFTPTPGFRGIMSFAYRIADQANHPGATVQDMASGNRAEMQATVYLRTPDMPTDPLLVNEWYIGNANILPVWADYTGKGIRIGQFEVGGAFSVGPEVLDYRHPDLAPNVDEEWLGSGGAPTTFSLHATLVAGVMVAARDGQGAVGVAYDATVAGHDLPGNGLDIPEFTQELSAALARFENYDIVNNSWVNTLNFNMAVTPPGTLQNGILNAVAYGRDGLGTVVVFAGGNEREEGGNTNYNNLTNNPAVITVGAINAPGDLGSLVVGQLPFSSPGASILVSAPGSHVPSTGRTLFNDHGSVFGDDYSVGEGTSFATPIVSGIVALMLEANPQLGFRDVQEILALTARKFDDPNGTDWTYNDATHWNGGGMHVSHDYGFGKVDALAAVRLAETWTELNTFWEVGEKLSGASAALNQPIPDGAGMLSSTLTLPAGLEVEFATVVIDLTHPNWENLVVKLIAPNGTESILIDHPKKSADNGATAYVDTTTGHLNFSLGSTHVRGEQSGGVWTLQVMDTVAGGSGILANWRLDLFGKPVDGNDLYVYTNEFASLGTGNRAVLNDANGGTDTLNASAVSSNSTINLTPGASSTIAGKSLTIGASSIIEHAHAGDGNDSLTGNIASNWLRGGRGNDLLNGGVGLDYLDGGQGNDSLIGGTDADLFVIRPETGAVDTITDFDPTMAGEKIVLVGFPGIEDFSQILRVQEGADVRLNLGDGQSVLIKNTSTAQLTEQFTLVLADDGMLNTYLPYLQNTAYVSDELPVDASFPSTGGNIAFFGMGGDDQAGANTPYDLLDGGDGNDQLWGEYDTTVLQGDDWIEGGAGNDVLWGGGGNDLILGGSGADQGAGEAGDDLMQGNTGDDWLFGGGGNDILYGGPGLDLLVGEAGNDQVAIEGDLGQVRIESGTGLLDVGAWGGGGADVFLVLPNATGDSGISSEATATGIRLYARNLIGDFDPAQDKIDLSLFSSLRNFDDLTISRRLEQGIGITSIQAGNDLYLTLFAVAPADLDASCFLFGDDPSIVGGAGADSLAGDAGGNVLDGEAGGDRMEGRTGDDTYTVDHGADQVIELPNGGVDTVYANRTHTLPDQVENLVLTDSGNFNGIGNALSNRITGNSGNNLLDGGAGIDVLQGRAGDDTYLVDDGSDSILENPDEGIDHVRSPVSYLLSANLENLTLTGTAPVNATGNDLANVLVGNDGNNLLNGAGGADSMSGGIGDDIYFVDNRGDLVIEEADSGIDTVYTDIDKYALTADVENLVLNLGVLAGIGNVLDNQIRGNRLPNALQGLAGDDVLDGGGGADVLKGGGGNDLYIVDDPKDRVLEYYGGVDTVVASVSYSLPRGMRVENLTLSGANNLAGAGNEFDNLLMGNPGSNRFWGGKGADALFGGDGNDYLDGGLDADSMEGGSGNDFYVVEHLNEMVRESAGEGTDTVQSTVTYALPAHVENLTLAGRANIGGTGNELDNILKSNAGANTLTGGDGNDIFKLVVAGGADTLTDFLSGADKIHIDGRSDGFGIGDKDGTLDGASQIQGPGGFSPTQELTIVTGDISGAITKTSAAAAIGSATGAYAKGFACLFVVDNGEQSAIYKFTSAAADPVVSDTELSLVGVLSGTASTTLSDFAFAV